MYKISPHGRNVSTALDHQGLSDIFVRDSVIYFIACVNFLFHAYVRFSEHSIIGLEPSISRRSCSG